MTFPNSPIRAESPVTAFELGRVLFEARIRSAWTPASAELRLRATPWPDHVAAERASAHDLAMAEAKAVLAAYDLTAKAEKAKP